MASLLILSLMSLRQGTACERSGFFLRFQQSLCIVECELQSHIFRHALCSVIRSFWRGPVHSLIRLNWLEQILWIGKDEIESEEVSSVPTPQSYDRMKITFVLWITALQTKIQTRLDIEILRHHAGSFGLLGLAMVMPQITFVKKKGKKTIRSICLTSNNWLE